MADPQLLSVSLDGGQLVSQFRFALLDALGVGRAQVALAVLDAGEDCLQRVVVALGNGVELVIVALGAADRQAQEGRGRGRDHVVQIVQPLLQRQFDVGAAHDVVGSGDQKAGGRVDARVVAGQLLHDELRIAHVVGEGPNDPIAIRPGVRPGLVRLITVALAETDHVEPVSSPALAVVGRGEQPVDEFFIRVGRRVVDELLDFIARRRQAEQVERSAADDRCEIGLVGRFERVLFERRQYEGVDRRANPIGVFRIDNGDRWPLGPGERPPVAAGAGVAGELEGAQRDSRARRLRRRSRLRGWPVRRASREALCPRGAFRRHGFARAGGSCRARLARSRAIGFRRRPAHWRGASDRARPRGRWRCGRPRSGGPGSEQRRARNRRSRRHRPAPRGSSLRAS